MEVIQGDGLPVYSWAPDLEEGARRQAANCAVLAVARHHVAVMADGHQGYGVPIGAVLALRDAISPYAVGNDIGCGMALLPTAVTRQQLLAPVRTRSAGEGAPARDDIMGWVQTSIPSGLGGRLDGRRGSGRDPETSADVRSLLGAAYDALEEAAPAAGVPLSTSQGTDASRGQPLDRAGFARRGLEQLGTLGSGNHFIELVAGPDQDVWVLLHSGSRGVGGLVCNNFHRMALRHCEDARQPVPDPGLAWLPLEGEGRWPRVGRCYERALRAALGYAEANRASMLRTVADIVERRFPGAVRWDERIDIHHNDATLEEHFGEPLWVHRKGAVKAAAGAPTITPGSMGTGSYLGRGKGSADAFCSCAHGAGRVLSRGRARRELSLQAELARIREAGGKVFASRTEAVLDEMPAAYKDLDTVMTHQRDLVEPVRRFTPLATYKGADAPRRGRGGWRPAEER
ncbi:MAG TPA: RtcB family protein [Acidimicrobiales bacterium]|nr:RtcB family protein [Acidimicrobiales bacterium]